MEPKSSSGQASDTARIAICGAGIGGLALAIMLKQAGFAPVVFEQRSKTQLRTEGVFLTLAPNGINALRAFDLADKVVEAGIVTKGLRMFNERGRELAFIDYGTHGDRFGAPSITIKRGMLSSVLLDAAEAANMEMHFGAPIRSVAEEADRVILTMDGTQHRFDALIACDGLRSIVRKQIFPDLPTPHYTGLIGTGGFADSADVASSGGVINMTFGRRAFFGYLSAPDQPVYWFNTYPAAQSAIQPIADPAAYADEIAALHRDDPLDNAHILTSVDSIERQYPIFDMPELDRWHTGRVVLMGDAAHAVAPDSGQGASMAIEDAVVLATCMKKVSQWQEAFRRFEELRRERTHTAIKVGQMAGSQKHAQSWLQLRIRDLILPLVMPLGVKAQERLFTYRADMNPLTMPSQ